MKAFSTVTYDDQCREDFKRFFTGVQHNFGSVSVDCPYELPKVATFYQGSVQPPGPREMELFLSAGFRRNGNWLYSMHCADCKACVSIRQHVPSFLPDRNQKRVLKKNSDVTMELKYLTSDAENLALCEKFLRSRFPKDGNAALKYFRDFFLNSITMSYMVEYRAGGKLLGTGIIDAGSNWMNAVYFYFDPDFHRRSPGTLNILKLLEICCEENIEYLYLGYQIDEVRAMSYKKNFKPYQLLINDRWKTIS